MLEVPRLGMLDVLLVELAVELPALVVPRARVVPLTPRVPLVPRAGADAASLRLSSSSSRRCRNCSRLSSSSAAFRSAACCF